MPTIKSKNPDESQERRIENFRALNTLALELFKALNILNAGAAAGMLAGFKDIKGAIPPRCISFSISSFVFGLMFGLVAMLFGWVALYKRLHLMDRPTPPRISYQDMMKITLCFAGLGLLCFCLGALVSALNINFK
jgi:ABC-type transport system involved in cytochrome c biogenesis permease subunit